MYTPWIDKRQLARALERNERFWSGELDEGPLRWITVPNAKPGPEVPEPEAEELIWTDCEYVLGAAESRLSRTLYLGDALPVFMPWLGPDQFAAWLGADLILRPRTHNTSWVIPFIEDWQSYDRFELNPENKWWALYLELFRLSVERGRNKWATAYPDLHSGIDALSAMRGPERLSIDLIERPQAIKAAMRQMTALWKQVVDQLDAVIGPAGQGTSNWTMGWSARRFLCIGQNDFTCMISPAMFEDFCGEDLAECSRHVDYSIYHLDGKGAIRHLPRILAELKIHCIQWIPGAGASPPSRWIDLLSSIQAAGKSVQVWPLLNCGEEDLLAELQVLCSALDRNRLFLVMELRSVEQAVRVSEVVGE